jgi:two-component system, OmpR family, sensor kinase
VTVLKSLTSRLVLTTVVLVLAVSVLIGAATTLAMRQYLQDQLDQQVRRAVMVSPGGGPGSEIGLLRAVIPDDGAPDVDVVQSPSDDGPIREVPVPVTGAVVDELERVPTDGDTHTVTLDSLGDYRVFAVDRGGATMIVGLPDERVSDTLERLVRLEALFALLATTVAAGAALVVVRRQLKPLKEVAATAHTVAGLPLESGDAEITERVPEHLTDEDTEVGRVGAALNTLLEHVETSLAARHRSEQQVRQFVADASHELRSPLATIAGYTELARRRPDDPATLGAALDKVEEESGRMTSLVEDLLLLARLDAGRPLEQAPVDLTRLLVEAVADAQVVAPDHAWRVDVPDDAVEAPYEVVGDALRLHQVVTNLLTNARKHTPAGTTVTVSVRRDGFTVHDDGPGFPPGLVDHAFERFVRGDAARTRGVEVGVGLGLALVEAIVAAHGGRVTLTSAPGDTTVDVSLRPRRSPGARRP